MKLLNTLLASTSFVAPLAFDNSPGWKTNEDGGIELDSGGNPIYVDASGREMSVEHNTISRLNGEAKTHREAKEAAEAELKKFEGISDPQAAIAALETVSKLDQKDLIEAGKVEEVKAQITQQYEGKLAEERAAREALTGKLDDMTLSAAFTQSEFVQDRIAVPAEMFQATFKNNFKVEDGKIVPYGQDGNVLYSKTRVGEVAKVDEAFELLVENSPYKDMILKAPDVGGTGGSGGGGNRGQGRVIKRADFDQMDATKQAEVAAAAGKGEITLTD